MPQRPDELAGPGQPGDSGVFRGESHFRRLLDKLPAGAYTCDPDGLITYYNSHAVQLWGRAPKLNDPVDRYCGSFKLFAATDGSPITHAQCWMALALRDGREYIRQEILVERPDGERRTVLAHASPIRDDAGKLLGAVNVLVDITDRRQAEDATSLLAAIVESSEDAIVSKTLEGRVLSWNAGAERLFGYAAAEVVGRSITLIIPTERLDEERDILARLQRGERIEHFETVRVSKDGRRIDISLTISPVRDGTGRVVGASKVARDITIQKQAQQVLRDADRRKDEFLATLAHELRNPLAPIQNAVHILRSHSPLDPALQWARDVIDRQVRQMARLVDDLLDLSRISVGKLDLRIARIELREVIHAAVETSRPIVEAYGHEFAVTLPPEPVVLDGDLTRLAQVVANLLNNAAKYTERGGRVELMAERQGSDAVVTVRDSGVGIPADMLPRVFDMFTQIGQIPERSRGGLGIGLTLVKRLVDLHGGSVAARSDGPGLGSEFTVRLPVVIGASPPRERDGETARTATSLRVLVVDDNPDAAATLGMLLRIVGNEVRMAHDGREAVALAAEFRPDVALLDIGLPGMNGYEAARAIRGHPWGRRMVLIAATGWGQESDRQRSLEAGFDHHLVKPVDPAALMGLLASVEKTLLAHAGAH